MGVRRRAVRERVERERQRAKQVAEFSASLDRMRRVINAAVENGEKNMAQEEFERRLQAETEAKHE